MRILVGVSGGVDSAVASHLLRGAGHELIGVTLQLGDTPDAGAPLVCQALGIRHLNIPARHEFEQRVIIPAAKEYARARTPNPCCECNEVFKFAFLYRQMQLLGCDAVATGHYAAVDADGRISRGADRRKDQSYFLYRVPEEIRRRLLLPLGGMTKPEARLLAERLSLPVAQRPDSQDVCFAVPGESCGETLRRRAGLPPKPGFFKYRGKIVGRHFGIHQFTVGQRNGMGVALGVPAFIRSIDADTGDIELETEPECLMCRAFTIRRTVWHEDVSSREAAVQIRYRSRAVTARLEMTGNGCARIVPDEPLRAVTPGQAAVCYADNLLLGGSVIDKIEN